MLTPDLILKALDNSSGIIAFALDKAYRYTYFTTLPQQIMKKSCDADIKLGDNILSFLKSPNKERVKQNFDRALAGEGFTKIEDYGDEQLQPSFWEERHLPMFNSDGQIIGLVVFGLEVGKYILKTNQLTETQNRLKLALNASKTGV